MVWLQDKEEALKDMHPVASEFEAIKEQWENVKVGRS